MDFVDAGLASTVCDGDVYLPALEHILSSPGILLVGVSVGYVLGARAARAEYERLRRERKK